MTKNHKYLIRKTISSRLIIFFIFFFLIRSAPLEAQSIVEEHGRLRVSGNQVVNDRNNPISLAGNSIFWSNFSEGAKFYNGQTVNHLASDWQTDIVRAAMGVEDLGGFISNPDREKNKVKAVVDAAIAAGVYVIIDWHSHNAEDYQAQAVAFFTEMATLYGNNDNVIYEVYNEPINQTWPEIKSYAEVVIDAIRAIDPDNLIVVGTPFYSQRVVDASNNRINRANIAYTLHFYAGTHRQSLRDQAIQAMNNGIALFVTEWGAVNANGDGAADIAETNRWMDFLRTNNISHANWSVSDKAEGASVVAANTGVSGLVNNNLTATGNFVKNIIKTWNSPTSPPPTSTQTPFKAHSIPGRIQGQDFDNGGANIAFNDTDTANNGGAYRTTSVDIQTTNDTGGSFNIGWIANNEWLEYTVGNVASGMYTITLRVASPQNNSKSIRLKLNGTTIGTATVPNTGGWQTWQTVTLNNVNLSGGTDDILRLEFVGGSFNFNWINFERSDTPPPPPPTGQTAFTVHNIPGVIEAENYDNGGQGTAYNDLSTGNSGNTYRSDNVDIQATSDTGGGNNVGWTANNEWLEYTIAATVSGNYDIVFRVASPSGGTKSINANLNGVNLGTANVPNTGGWQTWQNIRISNVNITQGTNKVLRLTINGGNFNINKVTFIQNGGTPPPAGTKTYTMRARGVSGQEQLRLSIGGTNVQTFTVGTSWQNFTASSSATGTPRITFVNDGVGRDAEVDWLDVNNNRFQAEAQVVNTSVYQNGSCGGANSQFMHCPGYIDFGGTTALVFKTDVSEKPSIRLYPNPTNGIVNFALNVDSHEVQEIQIVNSLGQLVYTTFVSTGESSFTIEALPSGIYFARIIAKNKTFRKVIIKN